MAARSTWRSRTPHAYPGSYEPSYYGGSPEGRPYPPPSSSNYYGTPRSSGGPPPDSDYYYHEAPPHTRSMSPPPSLSGTGTPYRSHAAPFRSQVIHRGTPPFSARGALTPRSHGPPPLAYADARHPGSFFPESPYARSRGPPGPPRYRQHLPPVPRGAGLAPWEPPSPSEDLQKKRARHPEEDNELEASTPGAGEDDSEEDKGGDPLALLAKVSSDMENKPGQKQKDMAAPANKQPASAPPTSPLRRTTRTSPVITPTTDNTSSAKRKTEVQVHPSFPEVPAPPAPRNSGAPPHVKGPKAVTPMPPYYSPYGEDARAPPPYHYNGPPPSRNAPVYPPYPPPHRGPGPASWRPAPEPEYGLHPAVVSHSFDSHDSAGSHDSNSLPPPPRRYYGHPHAHGPPHPYGPPSEYGPPPPGYPPSSRYGMYGPPPRPNEPYPPAPYSYAQQPHHMEEKTMLRKKFSWKHYPELERFLIANRDDYLEHSSKNYTAEQKQYNNWLTEELLAVAERHNYMFDPEDFNFVAIRDRIRCYYKSYVQTARKRGLELPGKAHIKKQRPANSLDKYAEEKDKKLREEEEEKLKQKAEATAKEGKPANEEDKGKEQKDGEDKATKASETEN